MRRRPTPGLKARRLMAATAFVTALAFILQAGAPASSNSNASGLPPAAVDIYVRDARAPEPPAGSTNMVFTVTLSAPSAQTVSVNFTTDDDTGGANPATAGADYTITNGTITFLPGERVKTIHAPVLADNQSPETDETFLVKLSGAINGTIADGQAVGTITQGSTPGAVLISELRASGPGAGGTGDLGDDYVEIYNNSDSPLTVQASDGSAGYALVSSNQGCMTDPVVLGVIPNGTIIPARGHYLFVGSGYSLTAYAAGNLTMAADLGSDVNVGLFSTAELTNLSSVNRLDTVGFHLNTGDICDLLRERSTLNAANGSASEYAFVRKYDEGVIVDDGVNADDFVVVSTTPAVAVGNNLTPLLGAPGPQRTTSPNEAAACGPVTFARGLFDPNVSVSSTPNRERSGVVVANGALGTLRFRRRFTNNTGTNISQLRFRIYDLTTFPSPSGTADLRALSSSAEAAVATSVGPLPTQGTTLETPPAQPLGGGVNSSLAAGTVTTVNPLAHGTSIDLNFLFGVQQAGSYRIAVLIEALPGAGRQDLWIMTGDTEAGGDAEQACAPTPADISGTKTVSGPFNVGDTIIYTVVLTNNGSVAQDDNLGDEFTDVLPPTLTLVSANASVGTVAANTNTNKVTWNGSLAGFASVTITIQATIDSGTEGATISNQGTIKFDADNDNMNEATAQTDDPSVGGAADPTSFKVNTPPTANGQSVTTAEDTPKAVTLTGSDADNDALTFTVVSGPAHGALSGTEPNLTYTPAADYHGPDSFTFKVNDGHADSASDATVSITVTPVADTPDAADATTDEDTLSGPIAVTRNAADGSEVTHFRVTGVTGGKLFMPDGTTEIVGGDFVAFADASPGLRFLPKANSTLPGHFTVRGATGATLAALGTGTDTSTITVKSVNDPPTLGFILGVNVEEDSGATNVAFDNVTAGVGESQGLIVTATSSNTAIVPHPSVNYTSPNSTGSLSFTPVANANGTATITVKVKDGGGGGTNTFSRSFLVTVRAINDGPVNTVPGARSVPRNSRLVFSTGNFKPIKVADVDAGAGSVRVTLSAVKGSLTLASVAGLTFAAGDGTGDANMVFTGTLAAVNAAMNGLEFRPEPDYVGAASLTITSNDLGNTGAGGAKSDTDTVPITVTAPAGSLSSAAPTYEAGERVLRALVKEFTLVSIRQRS